ncbi:MAG TPA: hypothetical protein VI757_05595 [Bacteroidia bacterium]|nr:hypothetical protein [Bacteroidia bacterium]
MILTSISLSLLALVAGMYLLDKTKKEGLGKFYNFISWVVIVVSMLILLCALTRGVWRMSCRHDMRSSMEMCRPGMMGNDGCMPMRGHHMKMMRGDCCEEMMGGGKMRGRCGDMEEEEEDDDDDDGMEKEIQKEIRIEKDTVKK